LKNPFYEVEMPVRCDLFNRHLDKLMQKTVTSAQTKKRQT